MKYIIKILPLIFVAAVYFSMANVLSTQAASIELPQFAPSTVIVKFRPGRTLILKDQKKTYPFVTNQSTLFPLTLTKRYSKSKTNLDNIYKITVLPGKEQELVSKLLLLPEVEYAELDYIQKAQAIPEPHPNDPSFNTSWQWQYLNTFDAWVGLVSTPSTFVSAIIDTGIQLDHPDLIGQVWTNPREVPGNGKDDDSNGYIDDVNGWNTNSNTSNIEDSFGHGTQVAGILAAKTNNILGNPGANWNGKVLIIKASINGGGYFNSSSISQALLYANSFPEVKVINLSLGGYRPSNLESDVVQAIVGEDKTILVAAVGNESSDLFQKPFYPASFRGVFAVGAHFKGGRQYNFGYPLQVVAPGVTVTTTFLGGDFGTTSGTSFAASHVAATFQVLANINPTLTASQLKQRVRLAASHSDNWTADSGYGLLDMGASRINGCVSSTYSDTKSSINISSPTERSIYQMGQKVEFVGSILSSDFKHFMVEYGKGAQPTQWFTKGVERMYAGSKQVTSGSFATWTIPEMEPDLYQVRVRIFGSDSSCRLGVIAEEKFLIEVIKRNIFSVSGKVVDSNNVAMPKIVVQFYKNGVGSGWVETDTNGLYKKDQLKIGVYKVSAHSRDDSSMSFDPPEYNFTFVEGDQDKINMNFKAISKLKRGKITLPIKKFTK